MNKPAFEDPERIMVFKTNLQTHEQKLRLLRRLIEVSGVQDASLDLEDCDRVLRIVSCEVEKHEVIEIVNLQGYSCEELI